MKKIFSLLKFIDQARKYEDEKRIIRSIKLWALECVGKTKYEMIEMGFVANDSWMVEVDDEKNRK